MKNNLILLLIFASQLTFSWSQSAYTKLCYDGTKKELSQNFQEAKILYTQAISLKPEEFLAYQFRGKVSYRLEEYDNSIQDLSKALSIQPKDVSSLNVRARAYMKKENYTDAIKDQTLLLSLLTKTDPLYYVTLDRRADAYMKINLYNEAILDLTNIINPLLLKSITPDVEYYTKRGNAYLKIGKYTEAIADLDVVVNKYPNDRSSLYMQGLAYFQSGDKENAKKIALKYFEIDPSKKSVYGNGNELKLFEYESNKSTYQKDFKELKDHLNEIQSISSENLKEIESEALYANALIIWNKHLLIDANDKIFEDSLFSTMKILYGSLIKKPTISEEARKLVVQATTATNDKNYNEAIWLFMKSLTIEPCNHLAHYNMALLYARQGNYKGAINRMEIYLALYPTAGDSRAAQDLIYEWEGKIKNVLQSWPKDDELENNMKNLEKGMKDRGYFIASYGFAKPLGNAALFNAGETVTQRLFTSGKLGMQNGFYIEAGGGGVLSTGKRSGACIEVLIRYRQHELDWRQAGGIFANPANYTKDFRFMEITEKVGASFRLAPFLYLTPYYSPAAIVQLKTEISEETGGLERTYYQISGGYLRIGHTLGASIRYRMFSIGYEWNYIPFKYDLREFYHDATEGNATGYDIHTTGKTKVKFGTVRLSLYL